MRRRTPGTWHYDPVGDVDDGCAGTDHFVMAGDTELACAPSEADARLMAAAPDLYEAVMAFRDVYIMAPEYRTPEHVAQVHLKGVRAVKKADGR